MQQITLDLPTAFKIPDCFRAATPEKAALILQMGADVFNSGIQAVASMSHDDIRVELREDYEKKLRDATEVLKQSEMEIAVLREMYKRDKEDENKREMKMSRETIL